MKTRALTSFAGMTFFAVLGIRAQTPERKTQEQIMTFDAPDASGGTYPQSVNPRGEVTGYYYASNAYHGFVRDKDGSITTFDAGPTALYTYPLSINPRGEITGAYDDASEVHGFVRAADGAITTIDAGPHGTEAIGINPSGEITGFT
jgi:hypothetical protein